MPENRAVRKPIDGNEGTRNNLDVIRDDPETGLELPRVMFPKTKQFYCRRAEYFLFVLLYCILLWFLINFLVNF